MNQTAINLLKYVKERNPYKDSEYHRRRSREIWDRYGEKPIKKAMNHSGCLGIAELERLAKYYLNESTKKG